MKTTNETFLIKQGLTSIQDDYLIYLFEQWNYPITDRDSATQIKVQGDATGLFSNGDVFIIPLDDFETEHTITSAPSYSAGENKTTIICSGSSFATTVVGLDVAKKRDITSKIMQNGFSEIRISTEGETLNSSLADDVQIAVDNSDEFFYDNDGSSGIFNSGRIFWIKIIFKFKDDSTEFLYFGGNVHLPSVQPISNLQNVEFMATGHLKELERYPGFRLTTENGILPKIPGITLISIIEPTGGIIESLRDFKLKYPNDIDIKNLTINLLSVDTTVGWHVIKFQPPDLFQYDFGAFTQKTAGATNQTLTAAKGHTINIDMPATFDIESREDWFYLKNRMNLMYDDIGKFILEFSGDKSVLLRPTFDRIIFHDNSGATYTDISRYGNAYDDDQTEIVGSVNDEIWFMTKEPIVGIYFDLDTNLVGTIAWYYSTYWNTYATLTKTDGTSNFSQSGAVTWAIPADHKQIDDTINSVQYNNYYIIKVKCTAYTSGSCDLRRALKHLQLIGNDNSKLIIKVKFEHLPFKDQEDMVILRNNANNVMTPCVWKENYSIYQQLKDLFAEANFNSNQQSLDNIGIVAATEVISLYGRPPFNNYGKKATAFCVGIYPLLHGTFKIFLGIEDELWSFDLENGYQFLDKLKPYIRAADGKYFKIEIKKLLLDGAGYLQGIAWKNYFDQPIGGKDYSSDIDIGRRTPAIVFRSTDLATITEQNKIDISGNSVFTSQEVCWRDGDAIGEAPGETYIGSNTSGENVCLPIAHYFWCLFITPSAVFNGNSLSLSNVGSATAEQMPIYKSPGFYKFAMPSADVVLGVCFTLGQKGFVVWDEGNDRWIFVKWTGSAWKMSAINYAGTIIDLVELTDYTNQILCGCYYNTKIYYAMMSWDEDGNSFPSDYSDCYFKRVDNDGSNNTTLFDFSADSVEANQSLTSGNENYCTMLDLIYNVNEGTIHGCLLNRADFEYHYFVYDVTNDKLYTTQTGTGFTFNKGRQIKELCYNSSDNKVYAVVVDMRNQQETAFLINASYTPPSGAPDGTEITLTYEADIIQNEYDIFSLKIASGIIYGLTRPNYDYLFQYDENVYPVMFLNDSGEDNFRDCLDDLAQMLNMVHSIGPERKFYLKGRESNKGSMTIYEKTHYIQDTMQPIRNWQHRYDGVEVHWENPFTGDKGVERSGTFGWQRRILKIKNRFIQYPQLAKLIADVYAAFFDDYRLELQFRTYPLWQLDNRDKFQFSHSVNRFDFAATIYWIVQEIILDHWAGEMEIRALEIKS